MSYRFVNPAYKLSRRRLLTLLGRAGGAAAAIGITASARAAAPQLGDRHAPLRTQLTR